MKTCPICDTDYPDQHTNCPTDGAVLIVSHELAAGSVVRGKYRIVRKLGQGGMGVVYLAEHLLLGGRVALKFLAGDLGKDPRFIKRFRNEARAAYQLRHPNIAEVTDLDQAEDGSLFIAMEFVEGPSLRAVVEAARGGMPIDQALAITRGIAAGLAASHALGTVHRDIKPENILMASPAGGPERPKILDFGIVAITESVTSTSLTHGLLLTPEYAAPEQWQEMPSAEMDGRTDLYALGCVLYELLTGRTPFHAHNTSGWLQQHLEATPRPPSELRPEINRWPGLDALVLRLLAKDREQRPTGAALVLAELDRIVLDHTEPMPEPTPHAPPQGRAHTVAEMPAQPGSTAPPAVEQVAPHGESARPSAAEIQALPRRSNKRTIIWIVVIVAVVLFVPFVLILAAIVIPSLLSSRTAANEASAVATLHSINVAEITYDSSYPTSGFACSLAALGGDQNAGQPTAQAAQLLPADVSSGIKSGYIFSIAKCTGPQFGWPEDTSTANAITKYQVTAVPQTVGKTGKRGFCTDESGVIKADPTGGTNCTQPVE